MTINITLPEAGPNLRPVITVMGVGGAGGNAVNNMISSNLEGVDFLIANTDAQALLMSDADINAMIVYLRSLPPIHNAVESKKKKQPGLE